MYFNMVGVTGLQVTGTATYPQMLTQTIRKCTLFNAWLHNLSLCFRYNEHPIPLPI